MWLSRPRKASVMCCNLYTLFDVHARSIPGQPHQQKLSFLLPDTLDQARLTQNAEKTHEGTGKKVFRWGVDVVPIDQQCSWDRDPRAVKARRLDLG